MVMYTFFWTMLLCLRVRGWHRLPSRVVAALVWVVREIVPLVKIYPPARDASQWFHYLQTPPPLLSRGRGRGRVHWPCLDYILFVSLHVITVTVGFWRIGREQQTDCHVAGSSRSPTHVVGCLWEGIASRLCSCVFSRVLVSGARRVRSTSGSPPSRSCPSWCQVVLGSPRMLAAILLFLRWFNVVEILGWMLEVREKADHVR